METSNHYCNCENLTDVSADVASQSAELSEIWAAISELQSVTMEYPTLMPGNNWMIHSEVSKRPIVTVIRFVDSYTPTGNEDDICKIDVNRSGSITAYQVGTEIIVAGNGSGKIRMNEVSRDMFACMPNLERIEGLELLDASGVLYLSGAFCKSGKLVDVDISMWKTPKLENMNGMFNECNSLETVKMPQYGIPAATTTNGVFLDCPKLREVDFGRGLTILSEKVFYNCPALEKVSGLENVTTIGDSAFEGCYALEDVGELCSATTIGAATFRDCRALKRVVGLENVTTIGNSAFEGCYALEDVGDLSSVITIGADAFRECHALKSVGSLSSATSIGDRAFYQCHALEEVSGLNHVTAVSEETFYECCSLKRVTGLDNVTSIGDYAFHKCHTLEEISDLGNVTTIGASAFCYTPVLTVTGLNPQNITSIGGSAFRLSAVEDTVPMDTVPLENIGAYATRRKRWSDEELANIQAISVPDAYFPVPHSENQRNYEDMLFAVELDEDHNVISSLNAGQTGCGAVTLYHIWQHLHRKTDAEYPDFRTWFTEKINRVFTIGGTMYDHVSTMIGDLGWSITNYDPYNHNYEHYISSSSHKAQIVQWLTAGKPVYASMHSANDPDRYHVVAIIGSDSATGKLAILDSGVFGTTGVISWVAYEDIFTEADYTNDHDLEYMYLIDFDPASAEA